ncbi:GIY-YIG nuclease family protein [Streptomyces sp. NPDC054871]
MNYEEPAAVYRLYDSEEHLLYTGLTRNPRSRWKDHRKEKLWWREVTFKTITWYATRWVGMHMEEIAIVDERPLCNAREECDVPGLSPQPYGHRIAYQYRGPVPATASNGSCGASPSSVRAWRPGPDSTTMRPTSTASDGVST